MRVDHRRKKKKKKRKRKAEQQQQQTRVDKWIYSMQIFMKKVIVVSYIFVLFLMECLLLYDGESLCSCKVFSKQTLFRKHFILSFYWLCESRLWTEIKRRDEGKWVNLQQTNVLEKLKKVAGSCHSLLLFFSWLALLFFELYRSFAMYEWGG